MNSDRIERIRKKLHTFGEQGYQIQHLLELTDFVDEHHYSFQKHSFKKITINLFISLLLSSCFILVTYPAAINFGFYAAASYASSLIMVSPSDLFTVSSGFPFEWLEVTYVQFSDGWVITNIFVKNNEVCQKRE
jgi:hypothetical protein